MVIIQQVDCVHLLFFPNEQDSRFCIFNVASQTQTDTDRELLPSDCVKDSGLCKRFELQRDPNFCCIFNVFSERGRDTTESSDFGL
jgi:hypothetical protein